MSSDNLAISIRGISKCYHIYDTPRARLKQFVMPRMQKLLGSQPREYFREFWALRDVSLEIRRGETVGIVGHNGSGKSTLLQIICGTLTPTHGEVETRGRLAALLELGAGFNPEFTGRENVYLNATVLGLSRQEIDERFEDILAFAEIGSFIDQPIKTYSSGMVVRLAFAVAINIEPDILVVDEALSVGDERFQRKCFSRIEAIRDSGATILFVSHSGSTVIELCDRAVLMDGGEMLMEGLPKQVVGRYQKLLYAPQERRQALREQIRHAGAAPAAVQTDDSSNPVEVARETNEGLVESFDPHLKPTSTLAYESHGAVIEEPVILTLSGEPVNNLVRGKTYRYSYSVRFESTASQVRFGMLIKTSGGVELGGASSANSSFSALPHVDLGSVYRVEFRFRCLLNSGVYFLNAGVLGSVAGSETYLHRLSDAAMFRVLPVAGNLATGVVDFECYPEVEPLLLV